LTSNSDRQRRLLDLLAGWSSYVRKCAELDSSSDVRPAEYEAEADVIDDLYQRVGAIVEDEFDAASYLDAMREIGNIVRTGDTSEG
jgi:hypothetical protein